MRTDRAPIFFSAVVPQEVIDEWIPRKTQIVMVELIAVVMAVTAFEEVIRGNKVVVLIDSEAVAGAVIKGYSVRQDLCLLVGRLWKLIASLEAVVYFDRVSTDANLSDGVSRGRVQEALDRGWSQVLPPFPSIRDGV